MHEFIMNIGRAVINFFCSIDTDNLTNAISIMGIGMLGIFIVTGVIILTVLLLNKLFSR